MTIAISLVLLFALACSLGAVPNAIAQYNSETQAAIDAGMYWDLPQNAPSDRLMLWERWHDEMPTWCYGVLSPNPVGQGQLMTIVMFNPQVPPGSAAGDDVRYTYHVDIEDPDGEEIRLPSSGSITSDSTGAAYTAFTPSKVGNYTVTIVFEEFRFLWSYGSAEREFYGIVFKESTFTDTLVVQEEQVIPLDQPAFPLPTEYWVRPIEGQNTPWWQVASNWYGNVHDDDNGGSENRFQPDGIGPNSAHILWTKVTEDGGLVGGGNFSVPGDTFNAGHQYQTRFTEQIIMWGRLYYEIPVTWSGGGGGWMCVDLKTGEEIWYKELGVSGTGTSDPSFGYYYDWDDMNQHGIVNPGWLFTSNFRASIHPRYGTYGQLNLTDVPSGTEMIGPKGEVLRIVIDNDGWMAQWNSSKVFTSQTGERSTNDNDYDWNVTIPWLMSGDSVQAVQYNDILIGSNGSMSSRPGYDRPQYVTFWGVSLKEGSRGQLLWMKNIEIADPDDNSNLMFRRAAEGVIVFCRTPMQSWVGYDMYTGEKLWETDPEAEFNPFGYFAHSSNLNVNTHSIAYGKLFTGGYTGAVFCYDLYTGDLLWRYEAPTYAPIFEYYTLMLGPIVDGKIYLGTHEHSADTPLYKGNRIRCLNVTTGEEMWTMYGWGHTSTMAVADGVLIYWNNYDHQVYAVGKGPSATSVMIQDDVVTYGDKVLVKGSVIDVSAGTRQAEQAARFPYGVPAVSDASMGEWMEYVYMQKPKPADVTGVEVVISVLDPNGNCYEVGTAVSDASGMFKLAFDPEVPGEYTVVATFAGSEGYWPSEAETALYVEEAPAATPAPTPEPESVADLYFVPMSIGTIVAIIVVGLVLVLLLRKR